MIALREEQPVLFLVSYGAQLTQFLSALSEAPAELVARAVGSGPTLSGNQSPWNRRRRRQLARGDVLVHLFSGAQKGEDWPGQVLLVEKEKGCDLLRLSISRD